MTFVILLLLLAGLWFVESAAADQPLLTTLQQTLASFGL